MTDIIVFGTPVEIAGLANANSNFFCKIVTGSSKISFTTTALNFPGTVARGNFTGRAIQDIDGKPSEFFNDPSTPQSSDFSITGFTGIPNTVELVAQRGALNGSLFEFTITGVPVPGSVNSRFRPEQRFNLSISAAGGGEGSCGYNQFAS